MTEVWIISGITDNGFTTGVGPRKWTVAVYSDKEQADYHYLLLDALAKKIKPRKWPATEWSKESAEAIDLIDNELDIDVSLKIDRGGVWYEVTGPHIFALHVDDYKEKVGIQ